jgi:hypothetical protein
VGAVVPTPLAFDTQELPVVPAAAKPHAGKPADADDEAVEPDDGRDGSDERVHVIPP